MENKFNYSTESEIEEEEDSESSLADKISSPYRSRKILCNTEKYVSFISPEVEIWIVDKLTFFSFLTRVYNLMSKDTMDFGTK